MDSSYHVGAFLEAVNDPHNAGSAAEATQAMPDFAKLPPELLPVILGHLRYRQGELVRTSLVCREWAAVSRPVSSAAGLL